jgi:uncharacterized protein YkwD
MLKVAALAVLACAILGAGAGVASARARSAGNSHTVPCAHAHATRPVPVHSRSARRCAAASTLAYARRGSARRPRRGTPRLGGTTSATHSAQLAAVARALATPCQNTQLLPEPGNLALIRAAVMCLVNRERAQNGELPLKENAQLDASAEAHVRDMVANDYFEHVSPSGSTPVDRDRESGYIPASPVGYVVGENLAWGTLSLSTAQAIVAAWIASPGHLANILESQYRETGIAIAPQVPESLANGVAGGIYGQEFGVITH